MCPSEICIDLYLNVKQFGSLGLDPNCLERLLTLQNSPLAGKDLIYSPLPVIPKHRAFFQHEFLTLGQLKHVSYPKRGYLGLFTLSTIGVEIAER